MPIEIRELHIKAVVGNPAAPSGGGTPAVNADEERDVIVAQCVEKVLDVIAMKKER